LTRSAAEYELTIERRPLYLYACVESTSISREMVLSYLLLIVKEIPASLEQDDFAFIASEIVRSGAQGLKIAVVDEFPDHAEMNHIGAAKAKKTGLDVEFFGSFASAVHWLLHG
jgi:hypothetical protein